MRSGVFLSKDLNQKFFWRIFKSLNFFQTLLQVDLCTDSRYRLMSRLQVYTYVQTPGIYICTDSRYILIFRLQVHTYVQTLGILMYTVQTPGSRGRHAAISHNFFPSMPHISFFVFRQPWARTVRSSMPKHLRLQAVTF